MNILHSFMQAKPLELYVPEETSGIRWAMVWNAYSLITFAVSCIVYQQFQKH